MAEQKRRELLKRGVATVAAGWLALARKGREPQTHFPGTLQSTLEVWMGNPGYDRDSLKPLADYAKSLHETSLSRGWMGMENGLSTRVWVGESETPEMLQESGTVLFKNKDNQVRGFIWNDYATFSLQGTGEERLEGILTHFSGGKVENYNGTYEKKIPLPSDTPIPFKIVWLGPRQFQGWIDFRGHTRKFGGGATRADFPKILMWRGD